MEDTDMEPFGNIDKAQNETQRVLVKCAVNAVITKILDNGDEGDDPLEQAGQNQTFKEDRFQKLSKELKADSQALSTGQRKDTERVL